MISLLAQSAESGVLPVISVTLGGINLLALLGVAYGAGRVAAKVDAVDQRVGRIEKCLDRTTPQP